MAAVVIFAAGILIVLSSIEGAFTATGDAEAYTRAGLLLQEKLGEIESEDAARTGKESGEFEDSGFGWETEISETNTDGLYMAVVTIKWPAEKELSAATYIRKQ